MKLYSASASPFVRKVVVTLHETGLIDQVERITVAASPISAENPTQAHNPLGKIPCLARDDGPALYDSRVITRYLDHRAGTAFYPEKRIWEVLTLEATADGIMDAAVSIVYERRTRDPELQSHVWMDAQWKKIESGLAAIETRWMSHLHGPLDAAQIAVACALGYLDFRFSDKNWPVLAPSLAEWYKAFVTRDSMKLSEPEG